MKKQFKFYKEPDSRWYIDLPEWKGSKADLEMVAGADNMLDYICNASSIVNLYISDNAFENSNKLNFIKIATDIGNGAYYHLDTYDGIEYNMDIWLCDVTKFIFSYFPQIIYIGTINK